MARQKGSLNLSSNIEGNFSAPLDGRMLVETLADLTNPTSFPYWYRGMIVSVKSEQKVYMLRYDDPTDIDNWVTVGTGKDGADGKPIQVESVTKEGRENIITLVWTDIHGADHSTDVVIMDGQQGIQGVQGIQGEPGADGQSFSITGIYDSYEDLIEAHPTGNDGDAYFVQSEEEGNPPDVYVWLSESSEWHNIGALQGGRGIQGPIGPEGFSPTIAVAETTDSSYKLRITNQSGSYLTPNLQGNLAPIDNIDPTSAVPVQSKTIAAALDTKQDETLSSPITIGETTATTVEGALTALNNKSVDVDTALDVTSPNPIANSATTTALNTKQPKNLDTPITIGGTTRTTVETALGALNTEVNGKVSTSSVGVANGVAELDANGLIPSSQLPSYVDDIIDCYYDDATEKLYEHKDKTDPEHPVYSDEITPVGDKLYVDKDSSILWRWTGTMLVSPGGANALTLGETAQTAYRGDRGKTAYDDSQTNKTNIGTMANLTTIEKSTLVGAINEVKGNYTDAVPTLNQVADKQDKTLSSAVTIDGTSKTTVEDAITALATLANYNKANKLDQVSIADTFDATKTYEIDDFVIYNTKLYKATVQHTGAWDANDFTESQVMDEIVAAMVSDYDSLINKPQIGGNTLSGNMTYSQLGIQQAESGKGLSTNDYDDASKAIVDGVTTALATKQPKTLETAVTIEGASKTTVQSVADAVATHTARSVTDNTGAHGLKVTAVSEDEDAIYYKSGNNWKQIQLGSVTQLEVMPTPAAKYVGKIYQYVGTTTEDYKKGYFYEGVNSSGVYAWQAVRVQSGGGQTIQFDPLPTAEASLVGALYQYVGTTTSSYTRGHFYECVAGETAGTFVWKEVVVDTLTLSDSDIVDIKAAFDAGLSGNNS